MKLFNFFKSKPIPACSLPDPKPIINEKIIPDVPEQIEIKPTIWDNIGNTFIFSFGAVNIPHRRCLNLSIDPSILFDESFIKINVNGVEHISKINSINVSYNIGSSLLDVADWSTGIGYYPTTKNEYVNFIVNRNVYTIVYDIDKSEQISEAFDDVNFNSYLSENGVDKILYEEELEKFIKDNILRYVKRSIIENFRQEIINFKKKILEKRFLEKINEDVIKNAFAFVSDLVNGCEILDVTNIHKCGYVFKIPMINNNNFTYNLDDTMTNLLFELSEGINKIKIEYKELDSYINFNSAGINIHIYPENTRLDMTTKKSVSEYVQNYQSVGRRNQRGVGPHPGYTPDDELYFNGF